MIIKKLEVAGLRVFEQAEFEFQPGMNLLVGVNGVGKTTVLDALRFCLSRILPEITSSPSQKVKIEERDLRIGSDSMQISCGFEFNASDFNLLIHKQKGKYVENQPGSVREQVTETPDQESIRPNLPSTKDSKEQPLGIFFSTRRSLVGDRTASSSSAGGGQAAAFAESFSINRDFNLREAAEWFRAQEVLGEESPIASRHLGVLRGAVQLFLPECKNLHHVPTARGVTLVVEKEGVPLNIAQLSDGERGVLSLVFDLARRLSQANPELDDPLKDGVAIVLIDELDLHLHPKWQRTVVENLTKTFPKCQFIATTHSPQVIPSVEPEQVLLLKNGEVIRPSRTFGMDSNWILKFLMDADDRPSDALKAIEKVEDLIREGRFSEARSAMAGYKHEGFDLTEWSIFEARMARMEILKK